MGTCATTAIVFNIHAQTSFKYSKLKYNSLASHTCNRTHPYNSICDNEQNLTEASHALEETHRRSEVDDMFICCEIFLRKC